MTFQFSLTRLLQLVVVVTIICALFASLTWPVALLVVCGLNVVGCIGFRLVGRSRIAGLMGVTAILILATLVLTDWGLSCPHPVVSVAWPYLIAACVSELVAVVCWLVFDSPRSTAEN